MLLKAQTFWHKQLTYHILPAILDPKSVLVLMFDISRGPIQLPHKNHWYLDRPNIDCIH